VAQDPASFRPRLRRASARGRGIIRGRYGVDWRNDVRAVNQQLVAQDSRAAARLDRPPEESILAIQEVTEIDGGECSVLKKIQRLAIAPQAITGETDALKQRPARTEQDHPPPEAPQSWFHGLQNLLDGFSAFQMGKEPQHEPQLW